MAENSFVVFLDQPYILPLLSIVLFQAKKNLQQRFIQTDQKILIKKLQVYRFTYITHLKCKTEGNYFFENFRQYLLKTETDK